MKRRVTAGRRARGEKAADASRSLAMAYIVPENRWCMVPDLPIFEKFVIPAGSGVLLPGNENCPVPGMMKLALLVAKLDAKSDGLPYVRSGITAFAVPVADLAKWRGAEPPGPVKAALSEFVQDDRWPVVSDGLITGITMMMPPGFVEERGGFGAGVVLPESVGE